MSPLSTSLALVALLFTLLTPTFALDNNSIRGRSIYQVLTDRFARTDPTNTSACKTGTYCGGTWLGLISRLDYIQGMGFDTVWISPIVDNIEEPTPYGEAYHGYWTRDTTKLNSHFGTEADLLALTSALHSRGMYLMVDIVVNHVATTQNGNTFNPKGQYGPFNSSSSDFHQPFCYIDYNSQTSIEQCTLGDSKVPLMDINTESPRIKTFWNDWIKSTVQKYNIDAIRIDTVKHVAMPFWPDFTSSAGVYNMGEIFHGGSKYVSEYQQNGVNPFNYPIWYPLVRAFKKVGGENGGWGDLLWNVNAINADFKDVGLLGGFVNNHDNPRFENFVQDPALRKNIHAFPLVTDGVPVVYYGSEAGFNGGQDPANREAFWPTGYKTNLPLYSFFTNLNGARKAAGTQGFFTSNMSVSSLSNTELLIIKSPLVSILSNRGSAASSVPYTLKSAQTGWKANTKVREVISSKVYTTDKNGDLKINVVNGEPVVLIDNSLKA